MRRPVSLVAVSVLGLSLLAGCSQPRPVTMAPPVAANPGYAAPQGGYAAPPGAMAANAPADGVFQWQDVPANQEVPIIRATFDQGGYQIFAQSGETIVVPFVNNNLYVMKFGRTSGQSYFRNENGVPTLYLRPGEGLENAAAQGARWYPIPQDYAYSQPMYVSLAPTWNDYVGMGWYPGMTYYGGMWGYSPYSHFAWMPGWYINVGGRRYNEYHSYYNYYRSTPGYVRTGVYYHNYNAPRSVVGRTFGSSGTTGSFGSRRTGGTFGNSTGSTGSFGSGRTSGGYNSGFGSRPSTSTGSFGSGRSTGSMSSSPSTFGSGRTGGSFSGGSSGISNTPRSGSSSFGGGRTSGSSSFGGGRSSGSSSFGGGSGRSSGSFGGGRRR